MSDENGVVNPERISDRVEFASALSHLRNRAGLSIRAVARELGQPKATIGGYFSGQHLPSVSQTDLFRSLMRILGVDDEPEMVAWVDALARVRLKPGPRPASEPCPYRGLESFRIEDTRWFFGRERLTLLVVQQAAKLIEGHASGIVMVVGPSGSGKTSLLRAGVVPAVLDSRLGNRRTWQAVVLCPSEDPLGSLAEALAGPLGSDATTVLPYLDEGILQLEAKNEDQGIVVVVDQFEEIFTLCRNEQARQAFLRSLARLSAQSSPETHVMVVVIVGLRADFYALAAREPALVPFLQDSQVIVGPMSAPELRRAIVEPARQAGLVVADELVELLLQEVAPSNLAADAHDPGVLPLLSHALRETWGNAHRGMMTIADYRKTGGIAGAVQQSAENTYSDLSDEERILARRILLRLVTVGDDAVTRRRSSKRELPGCTCEDTPEADCPLDRVVNHFVFSRLLTMEMDTIQISHEALLTAWPRFREWIDADREGIRLHRQIGEAAKLWVESNRESAALLRGARLELAKSWASGSDNCNDLIPIEHSFLQASADQAEKEKRSQRRQLHRFQVLSAVVAVLALIASGLARVAIGARNVANESRDVALSRQLAVQATNLQHADPSLAAQLSLIAHQIAPTEAARSALLDSSAAPVATRLLGRPGATGLAVSNDGTLLAVTRAIEGTTQLFLLTDGGPTKAGLLTVPGATADLFAVAFSPDGTVIATGGAEKVIRLWDVKDPFRPKLIGKALEGFDGPVQSIAFSPDGRVLAGAGTATGVLRWNVSNPQEPTSMDPLTGMAETTQSVSFSLDGRMVAAGGTDGVVRVWTLAGDQAKLIFELTAAPGTTINSVAFSPNTQFLAAGGKDQTIRVWNLAGSSPKAVDSPLSGFGSWVNSLAFSDDGQLLVSGSSDNSLRFWRVDGWTPQRPTLTASAPVTNVRFVPGTKNVVSVAIDGIARLWEWPGPFLGGVHDNVFGLSYDSDGHRMVVLPNHADYVSIWDPSNRFQPVERGRLLIPSALGKVGATGAISRDGKTLATGMRTFRTELWDITDLDRPVWVRSLIGPANLIEQIEFSPDGRMLAAASDDGTVRLWDLKEPFQDPVSTMEGPTSLVLSLAFSPDGRYLAAGSADNSVWLWEIADSHRSALKAHLTPFENYVYSVAFSTDGRVLAAGSADKTIRLWDVADPSNPRQLGAPITGPGNNVYSLAFSPTEPILSAGVRDGTVWQFDVKNPEMAHPIATLTAFDTKEVFKVAYSPDGQTLAAGDGKDVRFFATDLRQVVEQICATSGDAITRDEWKRYLPDLPYSPPCSTDNP